MIIVGLRINNGYSFRLRASRKRAQNCAVSFYDCIYGCVGFVLTTHGRKEGRMGIREDFVIVTGLDFDSLFGALPFYRSNAVPSYIDGLFEAVFGLTTTGASVIDNVEALSKSLLLWRSLTHWLGSMGIIILFIVFLPKIGAGAVHLFNAEVPSPMAERVLPQIRDNAARLCKFMSDLPYYKSFYLQECLGLFR